MRANYERLAGLYEVIMIEGAGSAAEVNLRDRDLVNWPVVLLADDVGRIFAAVRVGMVPERG